jgi:hypothetical protein
LAHLGICLFAGILVNHRLCEIDIMLKRVETEINHIIPHKLFFYVRKTANAIMLWGTIACVGFAAASVKQWMIQY